MRRTLAPVIVLILALAVHGCANTDYKMDGQLGATRPVTSFPNITPVGADKFIFSDASNSWLFSAATASDTLTALGLSIDSSGFNKNLTTNDDTLQEIVDKFDGLVFAAAMGADDNYVTDAEKTVIGNTSGTNTGDQTTVSGTAGGLAAQYIDWNAGSGGASIANKPTIPTASDIAYDATTWDASTDAPTKNTIRDVIESFPSLTFSTGLTETDGTVTVAANTYQPIDADLTTAAGAGAAGNSTFFGKDSGGTVGFHAAVSAPTVQAEDPTSASATGWYAATTSGDIFYKSSDGLFTITASYAADPAATILDDFSSDTTANYTNITQTLSISGGAAHGTAWENVTAAYHETTTGSNDHWVKGTCSINSDGTDSACLLVGSNGTQYYHTVFAGGDFKIYSTPGSYVDIYDGTYANSSTHDVAVQIDTDGSSHARFNVWIDGVQIFTNVYDPTDAVTRGPYVGMYIDRGNTNDDVTVDNLEGDAGAYTP